MGTQVSADNLQRTELEVLRAVANGRVRRSAYRDVYLRDGAAVPTSWVRPLVEGEQSNRIAFTTDAYPSGVAMRAELTVAGFVRVEQLAHDLSGRRAST